MHTMTLVAVEVPDTLKNNEEDNLISKEVRLNIDEIKKKMSDGESHIMLEWQLERLNLLSNEFGRQVNNAIDDLMEPYSESTDDPRYLEFENCNDEINDGYENGTVDCYRGSNGKLYTCRERPCYDFTIIDGKTYERNSGPLKHPVRTKKAKRYTAIPNYPYKKLFENKEAYADDRGYSYDKFRKAYGYFYNPNSFYDWYEIGGRWPHVFLVKNDCIECTDGSKSWGIHDVPEAPEGYKWVCAARKKDIEWKVMHDFELEKAKAAFYLYESAFKLQKLPPDMFASINEIGIVGWSHMYYFKDETLEQYLSRNGYDSEKEFFVSSGALLDADGNYDDAYNHYKTPEACLEWSQKLNDFVTELPDDAVLVSVDCHV